MNIPVVAARWRAREEQTYATPGMRIPKDGWSDSQLETRGTMNSTWIDTMLTAVAVDAPVGPIRE